VEDATTLSWSSAAVSECEFVGGNKSLIACYLLNKISSLLATFCRRLAVSVQIYNKK